MGLRISGQIRCDLALFIFACFGQVPILSDFCNKFPTLVKIVVVDQVLHGDAAVCGRVHLHHLTQVLPWVHVDFLPVQVHFLVSLLVGGGRLFRDLDGHLSLNHLKLKLLLRDIRYVGRLPRLCLPLLI